jgi:hypothetical protein
MEAEFKPVDMQELMDEGVLMAANRVFFWPLGLALAWEVDEETHTRYLGGLHVREWVYPDGHHESIELSEDDEVGRDREDRFDQWMKVRVKSLPLEERDRAIDVWDHA